MADGDDLPDDGRLDQRRIRAAVLEYRAAIRRTRAPAINAVVLACVAIGCLMLFADAAATRQWYAVAWLGTVITFCSVLSVRSYLKAIRLTREARIGLGDPEAAEPTDFTGLGGGPTVVERMAHITDLPDA